LKVTHEIAILKLELFRRVAETATLDEKLGAVKLFLADKFGDSSAIQVVISTKEERDV
jgi:hypothetical protein